MSDVTTLAEYEQANENKMAVMAPFDDNTFEVHPLIKVLTDGSEVITNVDVLEEFDDDHLACFILRVSTDLHLNHVIAIWHEDHDGLLRWVRAEGNPQKSQQIGQYYTDSAAEQKEYMGC